jgi:hypothetical protein
MFVIASFLRQHLSTAVFAAATLCLGMGIVERKACPLSTVNKINRGAGYLCNGGWIDEYLHSMALAGDILRP